MVFKDNLSNPIFIEVYGDTNSVYSISVVIRHPSHPFTSALSLDQDVEYTIQLQPFAFMNIQIQPITS